MEKLTGVNLANVRVHYNSPKPALVQAHAYAQGKKSIFPMNWAT
ncbi:hypothetical protein [Pseudoalteromonas luteoviolacea]|nr:hypothetical protein [Pseudoalteromonas luteoviolacea]